MVSGYPRATLLLVFRDREPPYCRLFALLPSVFNDLFLPVPF